MGNRFICCVLLMAILMRAAAALAAQEQTKPKLGNVLHCLEAKAPSFGYAPPRFEAHSYRIRYLYGMQSPTDEADELHIVVYGPREEFATLFEVYLRVRNNQQEIFIGDAATLKKEKGHLVADEIPGGQATLGRIEKLLDSISRRRAITVPDSEVKPGPAACVYEP